MENEFEKMYGTSTDSSEDEYGLDEPQNNNDEEPEDLIASGSEGLEYDFKKAPKTTKGPDRENLDGKEVVITDIKLILPKPESPWKQSKKGTSEYKPCQFIVFYDNDGQREYYSGVTVFPRDVKGQKLYSDPSINNKAKNQATQLKKVYAEYKGKKPEEISLHEFFNFLASKPKALIKSVEFKFDDDGKEVVANKNMVVKFL